MSRGPRVLKFPQDGEQSPPAANPEGGAKSDAALLSPGVVREGARRIIIAEHKPEGARRLSISEPAKPDGARRLNFAEEPMTKERGARRLTIEEPATERPTRKLDVPETVTPVAPAPPAPPDRGARRLSDVPEAVAPPPTPARERTNIAPPEITLTPQPPPRPVKPQTKTDLLVEKAQQLEPTIQMQRIRGRIDTILVMSLSDILDWGKRNLDPLLDASNAKGKIAGDLARIDPSGWVQRTLDASCKPPSLLDRFNVKPPSYWEGMLKKTRAELQTFVVELDRMKKDFFREIADLHLDATAMLVCVDEFADDSMKLAAQNRARTLMMAHQTAAQLQMTIEQSLANCAMFCQKIDEIMTVTIPQWKMALNK